MKTGWVVFVAAMLLTAKPAYAERVADNLQIMVDAGKRLEFPSHSENRAYMLTKLETMVSSVAVVFGYVDNAAACREIAEVLSQSLQAGQFDCRPVE